MEVKKKKLGIVVQRYGIDINGGAEYHARLIAEKMSQYFHIEVFTSSAHDYITWNHHYPQEFELINGIPVHRFQVRKTRDPKRFGDIQDIVFNHEHTLDDEFLWMEEQGPYFPDLLDTLEQRESEFDYFIFFSYRYYHSFYGIQRFKDKSILVPTAEHDPVLYLRMFKDFFNWPRAIVYNSHEEKEMIHRISGNHHVPGDIVGVGSEIPQHFSPQTFRDKFKLQGKYFIYIGRLDQNKGVPELLEFYTRLLSEETLDLTLVLMGKSVIDIPHHPRIQYLGFMQDEEKFDALTGAEFLIIPSQFESLSMVTLEAWAVGIPVVANGRTEVLQGQCRRSHAGLWYMNYDEFKEIIILLNTQKEDDKHKNNNPGKSQKHTLKESLGLNGKRFFENNYSWPVIEGKYLKVIETIETLESA